LECQTCPYQYILKKRYYERKTFTRKEREDVFGGPGAWDNADKAKMQCPKEGCDGDEAAFFQVQIRSADEPMTGFYKVRLLLHFRGRRILTKIVYDMRESVEGKLKGWKTRYMDGTLCFI
jgi:Transcription factor S-II (TFIIS)